MSSVVACHECNKPVHNRFCTHCGAQSKAWSSKKIEGAPTTIVFDKTLYPYCLFSCLFCCPLRVVISNKRVDTSHGWCMSNLDVIDLRRITEIEFDRTVCGLCLGRGTITIHASDETNPVTKISCFRAKQVYKDLRTAWNKAKLNTVVS
ncbi:uncharacterized protein MONBRDRAFT_37931 [Monosiga brevicollis MX1]|uniref:DUF304 domain-containing protein n=1 Tax=Monosiga brevicollis TaxID=81824 RepID=A9V4N5_MONBE|nr:uncharacterized protein MONBRDRAFT_37931 [Monosiga brevicollis MX1]EDQ87400.1 predicted protein [Monosiga brevicollis MX1]|eukprot:XP_001747660.1 hypothetical protein [Monosiga brevicollis MX1]